jgi:glycosyltransferase involved in cell wall biosynthesis
VAIPTLNGSRYIENAINSVLAQTYQQFELVIIDNHSRDETAEIIAKFEDKRIRYIRNKGEVDIITNWNHCLEQADKGYLLILGDDDLIYPSFLEKTVTTLKKNPQAGFVFTKCYKIDVQGKIISPWGYNYLRAGNHNGRDYILETARLGYNLTNSTTTLINLKELKRTGSFSGAVARNTFDFNMWLKIASLSDVYFLNEFLAEYREHPNQVSEEHWRGNFPSGKIGTQLEIINALSMLEPSPTIQKLIRQSVERLVEIIQGFQANF